MGLKFSVHTEGMDEVRRQLALACDKAEHELAVHVEKDTQPFVPALTGSLMVRTMIHPEYQGEIVGNAIVYPGPYARYLYYGKVMVDANGNGPMHFVDKGGNEVIKFPKGSKLHATDRNLVFSKAMHSDAQAHWCEASKAQNLEKWVRVAQKAVAKYGK